MKIYLLLLFALYSFVTSAAVKADETRGCTIVDHEGTCCWLNNNGCCAPPKPNQFCTMALTYCCKTKKYDEKTKTYFYTYGRANGLDK